jgi:hypothetical protein
LIRWLPDILAVHEPSKLALLIDGKQGERHADTGNQSIERDSLKTMLQIEKALNIPVWFVFPEGAGISDAFPRSFKVPLVAHLLH